MNYTSEMEKGMTKSRHVCYEEYSRKLEKRLEVEKQREREYKEAKMLVAGIDGQIAK
ncbi:hypothetical protein [Oceanobacillus profundus]|uniref:hypothetical protein n=1 Tax=Oceanobacillus profundus TaxID=372463 RepID=UPI0013141B4A|nr:hypothetical protein [Oceanobacillus profundus]